MKRTFSGLAGAAHEDRPEIPDGILLVEVAGAQFHWHPRKPSYILRLSVVEPLAMAGTSIMAPLYCAPKAMWKLGWFLRDFLYDRELLALEQVDESALIGLRGVVKISNSVVNGVPVLALDGFAPAKEWEQLSTSPALCAAGSNCAEGSR